MEEEVRIKAETIAAIERDFDEFPELWEGPASREEVDELEASLGFRLPDDYREFVLKYSGALVGANSIYGVRASAMMSKYDTSALEVTKRFRAAGWPGTEKWLIVSTDGSGNPIGLDENGKVWISDHDFGGVELLEQTFEDYLNKWCLREDPLD